IENATEEQLAETWTLLSGGNVIFALPRRGVLRGMMLSHSIHHRAQLGVYLRLNDLPVPSIYGPSADEPI
ncbi:MAG: damage-inducible protein DinB, partial [Acidobacteriota bacterium]|nr:damage-inducible protein DinB [Acidobacteriota bacterium]